MAVSKNWRGLVSLIMLVSGIIAGITGLVLYIVPAGRIAFWVIWDLFGLSKEAWQAIHTLSSYLLLIFGILHVVNNWSSIKNYIFKKQGGINQGREIAISLVLAVLIIGSAIFKLPPLIWVMDMGEYIKELWVVSEEYEPPFGHAEELSLNAFCRRMDIDRDAAIAELRTAGFVVNSGQQKLMEIASNNNSTPMNVYMVIKKLEAKIDVEEVKKWTAEEIEAKFSGTGLGRKTIGQIADQFGLEPDKVIQLLANEGIVVTADDTIKAVKDNYDQIEAATDLLIIILKDVPASESEEEN